MLPHPHPPTSQRLARCADCTCTSQQGQYERTPGYARRWSSSGLSRPTLGSGRRRIGQCAELGERDRQMLAGAVMSEALAAASEPLCGNSLEHSEMMEKTARTSRPFSRLVPGMGLEPTRPCGHQLLRLARLPFRQPGRAIAIVLALGGRGGGRNPWGGETGVAELQRRARARHALGARLVRRWRR